MALFDSIISGAAEKFGLGNKAGTLLSSLLSMLTDQSKGGFSGFVDRFKNAGLGDTVNSWISSGTNEPLTDSQVTEVLGSDNVAAMAKDAGVDPATATSALGYMMPRVVDDLTPDGKIPSSGSLLSTVGGYLSGAAGGAVAGAVGAAGAAKDAVGNAAGAAKDAAGHATDAAKDAAGHVTGAAKDAVGNAAGAAKDAAGAAKDAAGHAAGAAKDAAGHAAGAAKDAAGAAAGAAGAAAGKVGDGLHAMKSKVSGGHDGDGGKDDENGIMKWLLPLILLLLIVALGYWMCGKKKGTDTDTNANVNANANAGGNDNVNVVQDSPTPANEANANSQTRELAEISLPSGAKIQAYPGGIEDKLIKFIQSDAYKNGTNDTLKDEWFVFDDLEFDTGKSTLVPASSRQLANITAILKEFPDVKMKVGGYTDKKGNDQANQKLSDDRAKTVQADLAKRGVGPQVPEAEGYGEQYAKVPEDASDAERASDRRTAVRLLK